MYVTSYIAMFTQLLYIYIIKMKLLYEWYVAMKSE